jgi:succinylglutamate desuccinylase
MSKILIVGSTHGHERIGLSVIQELRKLNIDKNILDFEIGNPRASEQNVPFTESDLNRSFPGKETGTYEEVRAFELSKKILEAEIVIDIHSTNTTDLSDNSMLIVTKYDEKTKEIIDIINPPKVLYMRYKGDNALISQAKVGIAFEYGKDTSKDVLQAILYDICKLLISIEAVKDNPYHNPRAKVETETFEVYDVFKKTFIGKHKSDKDVINFKICKKDTVICETENGEKIISDQDFIPILFGENRYTEILGFKSRKI